jgi:hypothetical protein
LDGVHPASIESTATANITGFVRKRPSETVSERQLLASLLQSGRSASLRDLARWRGAGLLPPLASCGTGSGRTYYWSDPSVEDQARAAYDALVRYSRIDSALVAVWLSGFDVPLLRLRRALQCRGRRSPSLTIATSVLPQLFQGATAKSPGQVTEKPGTGGIGFHGANVLEPPLVAMARIYGAILESTDIVRVATDEQLLQARGYVRRLRNAIKDRPDHDILVQLLVFILGLLHTGQAEHLDMLTSPPPMPDDALTTPHPAKSDSRLQMAF